MIPKRVLIYRLGSLGDTLVAMPALRLVARAFPDAERLMLTNFSVSIKAAPMSQILDGTGLVHGYIEYPIGMRDKSQLNTLRRKLKSLDIDCLVYLTGSRGGLKTLRDALFFRSCGIRRMIGVPYARDQRAVRYLGDGQYEYEGARLARCINALGDAGMQDQDSYEPGLSDEELREGERLLCDLSGCQPLIAVSVGAKVDVKAWGDENWSSLLSSLSGECPGTGLVMLGSADERARCERLLQNWQGTSLNLCGAVSVRGSAAVMKHAQLFIGHDSGPMHLAASVGTPCVAVFSSRNLPGEWYPQGKMHHVLFTPMACQGCKLDVCEERNKECIRSISVADVLDAARHLLKDGGGCA